MPVLNDPTLNYNDLPQSAYGYSGTRLEHLGATEYTLATVVCDVSGSTATYTFDMEAAIAQIINACRLSPRADNLLLRLVQFDDRVEEIHGFKLLESCHVADYGGVLKTGGMTALYDASVNAVEATAAYSQSLAAAAFQANAILFVMTDGADNASKLTAKQVKKALKEAVKSEAVESCLAILLGLNVQDAQISQYLNSFYRDAGFHQYIEINKADAQNLARLALFVSQSIHAQSVVLGTGGPSSVLRF